MLFNSYSFLIFFLCVLLISRSVRSWTGRKGFLLLASYLFYASWSPPFILLLWFSTLLDWFNGRWMHESRSLIRRRLHLGLSLAGNLGVLGYFKYGGFLVETLDSLLAALGLPSQIGKPNVMLPIGISFYTFQTLSYVLDIYKGQREPSRSLLDYALYVSFFPELVAGPILRSREFLPQCKDPRTGSSRQVAWGSVLFLVGLFSKIVVADALMAPIADRVFSAGVAPGFLPTWAGTMAFAVQLFCDFFGYSLCAIGVALCLGFVLPDNFRFPYASIGFSDFWRRWHITLSFWLRDYLFLPVAYAAARRMEDRRVFGMRSDYWSYALAAMITMLVAGLWHGASWMFILWGGLHGVYLVAERFLMKTRLAALHFWRTTAGQVALSLLTFTFVCVAWVFFRAPSLSQAAAMLADMVNVREAWTVIAAGPGDITAAGGGIRLGGTEYLIAFAGTALLLVLHWQLRNASLESAFQRMPTTFRVSTLAIMLYLVLISMVGEDHAFIYFQF